MVSAPSRVFPMQVGFVSPPAYFDPAPMDFLTLCPAEVGVQSRLLHVPDYGFTLPERVRHMPLLDEAVACMAAAGADVVAQSGTNWSFAGGATARDCEAYCRRMGDLHGLTMHMTGLSIVEGLRALDAERIAVNTTYAWPDWSAAIVAFLSGAGFDVLHVAGFADIDGGAGAGATEWAFPLELARRSVTRVAEAAPGADAIVFSGVPNFTDGTKPLVRMQALAAGIEDEIGQPIVSSDLAIFWRVMDTLNLHYPEHADRRAPRLMRTLGAQGGA